MITVVSSSAREARAGDRDHRRLGGGQLGDRTGKVGAQRPPASDPPSEAGVGELRQDAARR